MIFDIALKLFLIGSMIFFIPNQQFYVPQMLFIQYSAILFFALSLFIPKKREISNKTIAFVLIYAVFHTILYSFTPESKMTMINLFFGMVILKTVGERVDLEPRKLGNFFLWFVFANIVWLILQTLDIDPIFTMIHQENQMKIDHTGLLGSRFALGCIGALMLPFIYSVNPWMCVAVVPLLIEGKSSTAILGAVSAFMFLTYFKNKKMFWILLSVLSIGAVAFMFRDGSEGMMKRLNVWSAGIQVLRGKPWFGFGLGNWEAIHFTGIQKNGQPEVWSWAHNEFFQYTFEQGLVGAVLLYAYIKSIFKGFLFNRNSTVVYASLISLFTISFWHFPFHLGRLAGISLLILAYAEVYRSKDNKESHV